MRDDFLVDLPGAVRGTIFTEHSRGQKLWKRERLLDDEQKDTDFMKRLDR